MRLLKILFLLSLIPSILYSDDVDKLIFSPNSSGVENRKALQEALDKTGTIYIEQPGVYKISGTVYIGSNTTLKLANGVFLKKVNEEGEFSHVILNKGALNKTYNENICIEGLNIIVNGMDKRFSEIYGLRGQLAFFYVKNLRIRKFRCEDLKSQQFGIHVCTFNNLIIDDVIIRGDKDGIHLGRGKDFLIRNCEFQTFDDAIALNAHDYATSNPELGWIENGVIENCHDLNQENTTGYFCRILGGAWIDWKYGMEVQQSDIVVYNNRIYRVMMEPNGEKYISKNPPSHSLGIKEYDGIKWGVVQDDIIYTAGVRNVVFRDIFLEKPRIGFSVHFDNDRFSRSYYPGAEIPIQEQLLFENVRVLHDEYKDFMAISTPMDIISINSCVFGNGGISFYGNGAMKDYLKTKINMIGCVFNGKGNFCLLSNKVKNKKIDLNTYASIYDVDNIIPTLDIDNTIVDINTDIIGLK